MVLNCEKMDNQKGEDRQKTMVKKKEIKLALLLIIKKKR